MKSLLIIGAREFGHLVKELAELQSYEKIDFLDDDSEIAVGKACIINAGAIVNHNSIVGDYCQVDCNVVVAADEAVPESIKVTSCSVWKEK